MRSYFALIKARFFILFQYKTAALAGMGTQIFWGLLKVMIFSSLFTLTKSKGSSASLPMTLSQTITFIWLSQSFLQIVPWNIDRELQAQIKNGNVIVELLRPLNLYGMWFARALAMRLVPLFLRAFPLLIIAKIFLGLSWPYSLASAFFFFCSLALAILLSAAFTTLIIISLFWTVAGDGITRLSPSIVLLFSGVMIPLPLFPDWALVFLEQLPFRGMMDIPSRIYTGLVPLSSVPSALLFQLIWTLVIILIGKLLLKKALKNVIIQGG